MKKSLIVVVILTVFSIGIWIGGSDYVNQGKEKVELTEQIVYGDLEKAKGILFQIDTNWRNKLCWSTLYRIGDSAQPETIFQFQQRKEETFLKRKEPEITIDLPTQFMITGSDGLCLEQLELPYLEIFQEVANRTLEGEERIEEVYLADYYSYYPLQFEIQSEKIASMVVSEDAQKWINQYFRIPILPDHKGRVSIQKNVRGEVVKIHYENLEGGISIRTSAVVEDMGCYFSFVCYNEEEEILDIKLDGQEYGIYFFPFYWETEEQIYGGQERYAVMEYEQIRCIYPLKKEEASVIALTEEGERLLFVTKEKEKLMLSVFQKDTEELVQRMEVFEWEEGNIFQSLEVQEDGLLIIRTDGRFCFFTKEETGLYQEKLQGDLDRIEDRWERNKLILDHSFCWDKERFIIAGFSYRYQNSIYLAVFQETGMVFLGFYRHSGDLDWELGLEGIKEPIYSEGKPILWVE